MGHCGDWCGNNDGHHHEHVNLRFSGGKNLLCCYDIANLKESNGFHILEVGNFKQ